MILTTDLRGGLGNQLFMIACGYALSKKFGIPFVLKKQQFGGCGQGSHPSKYYSNLFHRLTFVDSLHVDAIYNERVKDYYDIEHDIRQIAMKNPNVTLMIQGYFQSERFFKEYADEIQMLFTPTIGVIPYIQMFTTLFQKYPELESMNPENFVLIGVRRGDYLNHPSYHNPCGMTFYKEAISKFGGASGGKKYYISSDDNEWCKQNFKDGDFTLFELQDDVEQFNAMMLFKNYILSNSSYYWWGSYLSVHKEKTIIVPDKWCAEGLRDIYRSDMTVLTRPIEC